MFNYYRIVYRIWLANSKLVTDVILDQESNCFNWAQKFQSNIIFRTQMELFIIEIDTHKERQHIIMKRNRDKESNSRVIDFRY